MGFYENQFRTCNRIYKSVICKEGILNLNAPFVLPQHLQCEEAVCPLKISGTLLTLEEALVILWGVGDKDSVFE